MDCPDEEKYRRAKEIKKIFICDATHKNNAYLGTGINERHSQNK
jgi:hypothetical protein